MNAAQRANLDTAIRIALGRIGWTGPSRDLPYALNERYTTALAEVILAYPDRFDAQTVANARREIGDAPNQALTGLGFGEAARLWGGEIVAQAEALNPLSEQNRSKTRNTLIAAILFAAIAYFGVLAIRTAPPPRP